MFLFAILAMLLKETHLTEISGIWITRAYARMLRTKARNSKDLTEAEEIKNRWQEFLELYKKGLNEPDNHDGVVTHLEPDILESEGKWALISKLVQSLSHVRLFATP